MRPPRTSKHPREPKDMFWAVGIIPFALLIFMLFLVIKVFGSDALEGGSQVALLASSGVVAAIAMLCYHVPWSRIEEAIVDNIKSVAMALLILLFIGAISGTWMVSGVVPALIYYGLQILSPGLFLLVTCIICALVSLMTGSSWTTIATIGVALVGIGTVLGYSAPITAGAIISGAYFGDKLSPLSDTTVIASSINGTPLFTHIRYMMITTIPSFVITCIVFLAISLSHDSSAAISAPGYAECLRSTFNISPWILLVPLGTAVLIALRLPAILTLFLSSLMAVTAALVAQPDIVADIGGGQGAAAQFKGVLISIYGTTAIDTGNESLNALVETHGMRGMLSTIFLICCSATFGGALTGSGMARSLTQMLARRLSRRTSIVASTVATGVGANMATGDQYLSIILTSNLFGNLYKEKGFEGRLLSRATEDSATVTSVLIPWNTCGMTQSMVLRVPTLDYLPYCFFNILSPLMSIAIAATGYKIFRSRPEKA